METELRISRLETYIEQLVGLCGGSFLDDFDLGKGLVQLLIKFEEKTDQELVDAFNVEQVEGENVKRLTLRKVAEEVQFLQSQLSSDYYTRSMQDARDNDVRKTIDEVKKEYVHKQELNETLEKMHESFMAMCKDLKKFSKDVEVKLLEKFIQGEKQAEERSKASIETVSKLYGVISTKLSQLDLDRSVEGIGREMKMCEDQLKNIQRIVTSQEQALQRIDEVILEKASKIDLQKTNLQFTEYYRKADIDKKFVNISVSFVEASEDLKILQEKLDELRKLTDDIKLKQDTPKTEQLEYRMIKQQVQEIKTNLSHKIDRAEILSVIDSKVGMEIIDQVMEELDLNKRQTHLTAVMLLTTIRGLYTLGRDSMTSELKRREHLITQVENLVSWINRHKSERNTPVKKGLVLPSIDNSFSV